MRNRRRLVHVVSADGLIWDITEQRWNYHASVYGCSKKYFHSAQKAREDFESLRKNHSVRWLTYKNGTLVRNKSVGYSTSFVHQTIEVDHSCLNERGLWWRAFLAKHGAECFPNAGRQ